MESTTCREEAEFRGTASNSITERRYLKNVTPKTILWYEQAFKSFTGSIDSRDEFATLNWPTSML
jgi:hypothetical protein